MLSALVSIVLGVYCLVSVYGSQLGPHRSFAEQPWLWAVLGLAVGLIDLFLLNTGKTQLRARPFIWLGILLCGAAVGYMWHVSRSMPASG
ncbi:hypothetical protein [Chitinimonas sp.]|uniref:hypothetical protein n=1 Tax=Chitinimonas sp. TaxID=1934313 RepID=UPI002F95C4A7